MAAQRRTFLSLLLEHRGLSRFEDFLPVFEKGAQEQGQDGLSLHERTFHRWVKGDTERPNNASLATLEHVLKVPTSLLFIWVEDGSGPISEPGRHLLAAEWAEEARRRGPLAAWSSLMRVAFLAWESRATSFRIYEPLLVPALFQTSAYARAIVEAARPPFAPPEVERRTSERMERQRILERDDPPHLWVVVGEAALRSKVGGAEVMAAQLEEVTRVARRRNIVIQVLPLDAGAHASMSGGFMVLDLPTDAGGTPVACVEASTEGHYFEGPADLTTFTAMFYDLLGRSLDPQASIGLIEEIARSLREESSTA